MSKSNQIGFNKQFAIDINGINTEFVFHAFDNKWLLMITQLGKLPALYNVTFDVKKDHRVFPGLHGPVDNPENHVSVSVTMNCCLGQDTDEIRGGIQFLVNKTELNKCPTELVVGLGLKDLDSPALREIAKVLQEGVF